MMWAGRHRIPILLAAATLIPFVVLGWLALRLLQQDRDIERQRQRERLDVAAGRLALDIDRALQEVEDALIRGSTSASPAIQFGPGGVESSSSAPLLYQPVAPADEAVDAAVLAVAEVEEFQRRDLPAAAVLYRRVVNSRRPADRAAALVGLGRILRHSADRDGALQVYGELATLGRVTVAGQPAGLVGLQGRAKVFEEAGDREGLRKTSDDLAQMLNAGAFPIDRATFDLYRDLLDRWGGPKSAPEAIARTDAAIELWRAWRGGELAPRGRRLLRPDAGAVLVVWAGAPDHPSVWLATAHELNDLLRPLWTPQHFEVSLTDVDGQPVAGDPSSARVAGGVSLTPSETRLPFLLNVALADGLDASGVATRRLVLIGSLGAALFLMLAAAYGLYRATTREMGLARQQSDFVAAISHEFRTPLTSMRHLTDLLVTRGSVTSDDRKTQYYGLLAHETERLHRMVETLLSFGRIEEGAYAWRLEPTDCAGLVRASVEEFRRESLAEGRSVHCEIDDALPAIPADREALSRALWNLLENAAKYSEPDAPIRVFARRHDDTVLMGVTDEGAGIPADERRRIFQKFVRGSDAKRAGIRGVGLGLALVSRIVEAHGGAVRLESEPGRGSTFTLVLPCHAS